MAENIIIAIIVLICLLLLARHFFRLIRGQGCGCGPSGDKPSLQRDLPDLRSGRPTPPPKKDDHPPEPYARR